MAPEHLYKVIFFNQGQYYEVYAASVGQGSLFGFIEISDLVFGEKTQVVVDPGEERLEKEFEGVTRFYVPMHSVVRIDQVERKGTSRITPSDSDAVAPFPMPVYPPPGKQGK